MRVKVTTSPAKETGPSAAAKVAYGIWERPPIMMFCGLPVIVAADPTFEAMATARRYGTGRRPSAIVSSNTSGVRTRQIASLTRKAENTPEIAIMPLSRSNGRAACELIQLLTTAKKPESLRLATTIIIPSNRVSVSRSIAL